MIVADTCLITHLFNQTGLTSLAQEVLEKDPFWIMPKLWQEEYANVLSKLARKEGRPIDDVIKHFDYTLGELQNCDMVVEIKNALHLSLIHKISVYDAHFIALAIEFDTLVVTEDIELLKKCPQLSVNMQKFLEIEWTPVLTH